MNKDIVLCPTCGALPCDQTETLKPIKGVAEALDFLYSEGECGLERTSTEKEAYLCFKYHGEAIRKALELAGAK